MSAYIQTQRTNTARVMIAYYSHDSSNTSRLGWLREWG